MNNKITLGLVFAGLTLASCGSKNPKTDDASKTKSYSTINEGYMDKSVRPQDDFFQYANGSWCANNPVPPSESRWGSFNELDKNNKVKLTTILESASKSNAAKGTQDQILGDYYTSYLNMSKRDELGISPIKAELEMISGMKEKSDLPSVLAKLHKNGVGAAFYFGVGQDLKNVSGHMANLFQNGLSLPNKDYYSSDDKSKGIGRFPKARRGRLY